MTASHQGSVSFPEDELTTLARAGGIKAYPKGTIVVSEGDETDAFYVILQGRVKVFASDEDGKEIVLATQRAGECFGEIVLDGGPRSASVMTLEPAKFAVIPHARFREFLHEHPAFAAQLVEKLAERVRGLTATVKSLALMDVYGRVARLLLDLAVEHEGRMVVPDKLTQQELANRVGASREMVSRILKDLTLGGYIVAEEGRYVIRRKPPRRW